MPGGGSAGPSACATCQRRVQRFLERLVTMHAVESQPGPFVCRPGERYQVLVNNLSSNDTRTPMVLPPATAAADSPRTDSWLSTSTDRLADAGKLCHEPPSPGFPPRVGHENVGGPGRQVASGLGRAGHGNASRSVPNLSPGRLSTVRCPLIWERIRTPAFAAYS